MNRELTYQKGDQGSSSKNSLHKRSNQINSLTDKIFQNDKIVLGANQFTYKPLNMSTVVENPNDVSYGKGPIGKESTQAHLMK